MTRRCGGRAASAAAVAALAVFAACTSAGPKAGPRAHAEVTVVALTPAASTRVEPTSVVDATIDYSIDRFQAAPDRYYLSVQFEAASGGGSFNGRRRLADEPVLTVAHGTVHVTYPLADVWEDRRLRRPITMWFYLLERTGPHDSIVIGRVGPFAYDVK